MQVKKLPCYIVYPLPFIRLYTFFQILPLLITSFVAAAAPWELSPGPPTCQPCLSKPLIMESSHQVRKIPSLLANEKGVSSGQRDNTVGRALALYIVKQFESDTTKCPLRISKSDF